MVGGTNLRPTMQTSVHFDNFAELYKVLCSVVSMSFLTGTCPSSETQGQIVGGEGKSKKAEWRRLFGTGLVRHCPHGLFSPFFTFLRAIFFRPFRLSLAPTICPWVSEDGTCQELKNSVEAFVAFDVHSCSIWTDVSGRNYTYQNRTLNTRMSSVCCRRFYGNSRCYDFGNWMV